MRLTTQEADIQADAMARRRERYRWRRSARGNLWRPLPDGTSATIYRRPEGGYAVVWNTPDGPRFETEEYGSEQLAMKAVHKKQEVRHDP